MKTFLTFLSLLWIGTATAQNIEMRSFDWVEHPTLHKLNKEEAAEPLVLIEDQKVVEYIYNRNMDVNLYAFRHRIIHLNEKESVDSWNKLYIPVNSADQLVTFKARSISPEGKITEMLRGEMKPVTDEGQLYMSLAIDGVVVGSEVEFYYVLLDNVSYTRAEYIQGKNYIRHNSFTIVSPENLILKGKVYNSTTTTTDSSFKKKNYVFVQFNAVKPLVDEKYSLDDANKIRVEYKLFKNTNKGEGEVMTFADAGNLFYERMMSLTKNEQKDLEKVVAKIKLKDKSDVEKARAIEAYLKMNFNIKEDVDIASVSEAINKNISDKATLNKMAINMSKIAGLKTEMVISISRYDKKFDPTFQTWNYLDEILLYYPSLGKYMMPTNFVFRLGEPPLQYLGVYGLFVKEIGLGDVFSGVSSVKKIAESDPANSSHNLEATVTFEKDFTKAKQVTAQSLGGFSAVGVRPYYFYATEEKRKEMVEELMKNGIDGAKVTNLKVSNYLINSDEVDKPFIVNADVTYSSLIEKAGNGYFFKVGEVIGPQVEMYQEKDRKTPMDIDFPHSLIRKIVVKIPEGYTAKGLEKLKANIVGGDVNNPTMGFISDYKINGDAIEININEFYNVLTYPFEQYEAFRKVINASSDFNKVSILFAKNN